MRRYVRIGRAGLALALLGAIAPAPERGLAGMARQRLGTFVPHPTAPSFGGGANHDAVMGDLDDDGDLDAVTTNLDDIPDTELTVWLNNGSGVFAPHPIKPTFGTGGGTIVVLGDIDGDGDLDLVAGNYPSPQNPDAAETVWLNDGRAVFSPHPVTPRFGGGPTLDVELGDIDGDGDLDALAVNRHDQPETVWLNDGAGSFTPHPTAPSFGAGDSIAVGLGDLDGDQDLDALITNFDNQPETVWLNDGTGVFTPHPTTPSFGGLVTADVALGDLDGDGDLDALVVNAEQGPEGVWLNDGTGSFTPHPTAPSFGASDSYGLALGDIDSDGDLDALIANGSVSPPYDPETVWLNDGTGVFAPHPTTPSFGAGYSSDVILGDLDGDGDLDALVANMQNDGQTVWINRSPLLCIDDAAALEGDEGPSALTFAVRLSDPSDQTISVGYATADDTATPDDYLPISGTLTFAPGALTQSLTVTLVGDTLDEGNERLTVALAAPLNAALLDAAAVGVIGDDDLSEQPEHAFWPLILLPAPQVARCGGV